MLLRYVMATLLLAAAAGCAPESDAAEESAAPAARKASAEAPAGPSPADVDYREITESWGDDLHASCGPALEEALGTRDLVDGVLGGLDDPEGRAAAEIEDATHWMERGNTTLAGVRPALEQGNCDAEIQVALEETWQFYVKAGTSAVQASQIAGG
ncbi:MAG TPA: hypothetical protein VML95_05570 [Longimicrobiales bacterium]|nr:hypothetical protein [Longimicrobiales bacterium]